MIDDKWWRTIVEAAGDCGDRIQFERGTIDRIICDFRDAIRVEQLMKNSAHHREQWMAVRDKAVELKNAIQRLECWYPPIWLDDVPPETQPEFAQINALIAHADFCIKEHDEFVRGAAKPHHNKLFADVLEVWAVLGHPVTWSAGGPTERFLRAVLIPVLQDDMPKSTTIRDIINRLYPGQPKCVEAGPRRQRIGKVKPAKNLPRYDGPASR